MCIVGGGGVCVLLLLVVVCVVVVIVVSGGVCVGGVRGVTHTYPTSSFYSLFSYLFTVLTFLFFGNYKTINQTAI